MASILSEYITPPPPFMAGTNALDKAISDIWSKRRNDEQNRIDAAQQVAQQRDFERRGAETSRHNVAQEAYDRGKLRRDLTNDQLSYINDTFKAYGERNYVLADALAAQAGLLGIAPQVMAAPVTDQGATDEYYTPDGRIRGPEPGTSMSPVAQPSNEGTIPGTQRMVPELTPAQADAVTRERVTPPVDTAAVPPGTEPLPQAAWAAPVQPQQAELNAPQAPAPPQPAGDPSAPPASSPMPPTAAPPQQAAPGGQVRREDIHIQPKPPSQLGVSTPVAPGTPAALPEMPWANDPSQHPIAREADPNWEGRLPTTFPGAPSAQSQAGPGRVMPTRSGAVAGAAPGAVDPATDQRWRERGRFAAPVMPDPQQAMSADEERVRAMLQPQYGYATNAHEMGIVRSAIEGAVAATRVMTPEKAAQAASAQIQSYFRIAHQDTRSENQATAQANKFGRTEERLYAQDYLADRTRMLKDRGVFTERATYETMGKILNDLSDYSNPKAYNAATRSMLKVILESKGVQSDADALAGQGLDSASIIDWLKSQVARYSSGGESREMHEYGIKVVSALKARMEARTYFEYQAQVQAINQNAPNAYAKKQARANLDEVYRTYNWFANRAKLTDEEAAALDEAEKAKTKARRRPNTASASTKPKPEPKPESPTVPNSPLKPPVVRIDDLGGEVR